MNLLYLYEYYYILYIYQYYDSKLVIRFRVDYSSH